MIQRLTAPEQLGALPERGVMAQKIRALLCAYGTGYDFCRFFLQGEGCFIALFGGSAVICGASEDRGELAEFLHFSGAADILCSEECGRELCGLLPLKAERVNLLRFCGAPSGVEVNDAPALSEVYGIISKAFEIEFEPWYLDMSHRVRHGVARCFTLESYAACVLQHDINGEALISQVATLPERRGEGLAKRLIHEVCRRCSGSEVYVICEDRLLGFYEKLGFERVGGCAALTAK